MTDPAETLKMFQNQHEKDLISGIEEDNIPTSEPEDKMHVHVIPDEGEVVIPRKYLKSSYFTYHNKDAKTGTSE